MVVILHEGKDDKKYIKRLFEHLDIKNYSDENFHKMNDKPNFFKKDYTTYRILKQKIENDEVTKVLFLLDADYIKNDCTYGKTNTIKNIKKLISELDFEFNYEIFIVCEPNKDEGYFETLFLSSVSDDLKNCYQSFMKCTGFTGKEQTKTIMMKLHELASPQTPYSFEHENFKDIKEFLTNNFK
ncbi:MAG: hypothetical protein CL623_11420 [Arcobacter sp.]|nr:hypothetical protein [Arcobacter sp.]|tara:strand:+ start:7153 stop:7704 length:552 start_codon:yes stop_codon:yes gene_type:complete